MLDADLRRRLIEALCTHYPSPFDLEELLSLRLDRELLRFSAPDRLTTMAFKVVMAAEAGGWDGALIDEAADDSPHSTELAAIRAAFAERARPAPVAVAAPVRLLDLALIAPDSPLVPALHADPRVGAVASFPTVEAAAEGLPAVDALVVSTAVTWPARAGAAVTRSVRDLPVVLVEARASRGPGTPPGVAPLLAERVTQIVVLDEPVDAVRRIVDHLSVVIHPGL